MARSTRRDQWDDLEEDRELPRSRKRKESSSFSGTILAAVGFGVTLIIGGVIGFAAGRAGKDTDKPRSPDIAENQQPAPKQPVVEKTPTPTPPAETKQPTTPKTTEPTKKKPSDPLKKPNETNKKPDPPKTTEPPKEPDLPKKTEPPKPPVTPPAAMPVSFQKDILPIFKAKCNVCHGDASKKGDLDLRTLASALKGGDNGAGAKPGKLDESQIWTTVDSGSMPPAGKEKLTAKEIQSIKDWILTGAK